MAVYNDQLLYLDLPKTGTVFVVKTLAGALTEQNVLPAHEPPPRDLFTPARTVFATFRHPLAWYVSHWAYAQLEFTGYWRDRIPDDDLYESDDPQTFQRWLAAALTCEPGCMSRLLLELCHGEFGRVQFWLPTDGLRHALTSLLPMLAERKRLPLKPDWRRHVPLSPANCSRHRPYQEYYVGVADLTKKLREAEEQIDKEFRFPEESWQV